ncbi:LysR family transcriptional regulator [Amaricoccus macauensis]|uniref:LysR family transcriptional regulator n=1 Tax=Amaricoccus macauensis TaxID=57001 RepID=UPI003C799FE4
MTFEQLRVFVEAARYGNFTFAARALGLSQAAVSMAVRRLEEQHEVTLFDRSSRNLALTEAGQTLLGEAERILRDLELTSLRLESFRSADRRVLIIACTRNAYNYWLSGVATHLRGRRDDSRIELICGSAEDVAAWVLRGTADAGVSESNPGHPMCRYFGVFRDCLIVGATPDLAAQHPRLSTWTDIQRVGPILAESGTDLSPVLQTALEKEQIDTRRMLHRDIRLESSEAVVTAALEGRYPALVSETVAKPYLDAGRIVRIGPAPIVFDYWCFGLQPYDIEPLATLVSRTSRKMRNAG